MVGLMCQVVFCAGMGAKLTTYYRRKSPTDSDYQRLLKGELLLLLLLLLSPLLLPLLLLVLLLLLLLLLK